MKNYTFLLLSFCLSLTHLAAAHATADEYSRCVTELRRPELHPGWSLERRQFACYRAGTDCVLTLAELRSNWNEILLNEECRDDQDNCVGKLARRLVGKELGRQCLRTFCREADIECVVATVKRHPTWRFLDLLDYCRLE